MTLSLSSPIKCSHCKAKYDVGASVNVHSYISRSATGHSSSANIDGITIKDLALIICQQCDGVLLLCCHCNKIAKYGKMPLSRLRTHVVEEHYNECDNGGSIMADFDHYHEEMMDIDWTYHHFKQAFTIESCAMYFFQEFQDAEMGGMRGIVYRCMHHIEDVHQVKGDDDDHVMIMIADKKLTLQFFRLLVLLDDMPESMQELQMDFVDGMIDMLVPPDEQVPLFPNTIQDANDMILRNKFSMKSQLPCPRLTRVDGIHAKFSICDTISIMMGQGIRPCFMQDESGNVDLSGINGTPAARVLLAKLRAQVRAAGGNPDKTAFGWLTVWSDGFQTSFIKQKKNSAWIMVLTVSSPRRDGRSVFHSYVIAMGPAKQDHSHVVNAALDEIAELGKGKQRYCGATKSFINTSFGLIVVLGDRPERCDLASTGNVKGLFSKRFQWAAPPNLSNLPSCYDCYNERIKVAVLGLPPSVGYQCQNQCCNWDYENNNNGGWSAGNRAQDLFPPTASNRTTNYPTKLPVGVRDCPEGREIPATQPICPVQQTFCWIIAGVLIAFRGVASGEWKKYHLDSYLRTFNLATEVYEKCYASAMEVNNELKGLSNEEKERRLNEIATIDELLRRNVLPRVWTSHINLQCFIEIPMHLLFSGIIKDVILVLKAWIKKNRHGDKFLTIANQHMEMLSALSVSFCKAKPLPIGRWVSENFICFTRAMPFFYSLYFNNFNTLTTVGSEPVHILYMQRLINATSVMISCLMSPQSSDITVVEIDDAVKIFLSAWDDVKNKMNQVLPESVVDVFQKGNHLSLLNLRDQIKYFGPMRLFYEGDQELMIQDAKPGLGRMRLSQSFYQNALVTQYQKKFIKHFRKKVFGDKIADRVWQRDHHRYQSLDEAAELFREGNIMACLQMQGGSDDKKVQDLWIIVGWSRKHFHRLVKLTIDADANSGHDGAIESCGFVFAKMKLFISGEHEREVKDSDLQKEVRRYCILLPFIIDKQQFTSKYTIITEQWESLQSSGSDNNDLCLQRTKHSVALFTTNNIM